MLIKEFRVVLPLTVDEFQVGQLYSVAMVSRRETGGGEGVEVLRNEPFSNRPLLNGRYSSGQYTYKIYHLHSKVPGFIRLLAPRGALEIHEESWNAYPYCRTVIAYIPAGPSIMPTVDTASTSMDDESQISKISNENPTDSYLEVRTLAAKGPPFRRNVHELPPDKLQQREVTLIDIANDFVLPGDYDPKEDPTIFQSVKTGRGPLVGKWMETTKPLMTCYKLVTCEFKWWGFQGKIESFLQRSERRLFLNFHRQVFCWIDEWYGLKMSDIRAIEDETKRQLDRLRKSGAVRGTRA
ncbi:unnamed protein product [Darwinula stevensoni]|uniref:Phosphatidylinositol transfer protein N-terminal domain-containing protein n=1 Tax=Darwinula stevensoni TaxID=69355 RepID=A0A7R8ZX35_9CRUS|nr:unnamed protein product [Darwinula stevensoni]CAG0878626.1 unnamed protein product [Darwinula stevensoni]